MRHGERRYRCTLEFDGSSEVPGGPGDAGTVKLNADDQGLAPGQFAVFYDGHNCLGCGIIMEQPFMMPQPGEISGRAEDVAGAGRDRAVAQTHRAAGAQSEETSPAAR